MMGRRAGRLALAALVIAVAPGAIAIGTEPAAAAGTNCVPVPDLITVAIVIDDGRSSPRVDCMSVPKGSTGVDLLKGRDVRYDTSGLLCAIDGYPTTGCGDAAGGSAYSYWSYWWKDGSNWKYATTGPATRRLTTDGMVEGWHFITGRDVGAGNAPRLAPTSITFGAAPPPPPPATTPPVSQPTGVPPAGGNVTNGSTTNGSPTGGSTNGSTGSSGSRTPTSIPNGAPTDAGVGGDGGAGASTSTSTPAAGIETAPTSSTDPSAVGSEDVEVEGESVSRAEPLAMTTGDPDESGGSGGLLAGTLLAVAVVGAVGSVVLRRRRSGR